jgi:hypothetical protein
VLELVPFEEDESPFVGLLQVEAASPLWLAPRGTAMGSDFVAESVVRLWECG